MMEMMMIDLAMCCCLLGYLPSSVVELPCSGSRLDVLKDGQAFVCDPARTVLRW
jgi:hypothetical protein